MDALIRDKNWGETISSGIYVLAIEVLLPTQANQSWGEAKGVISYLGRYLSLFSP